MNSILMELSPSLVLILTAFVIVIISSPQILFKPHTVYLKLQTDESISGSGNHYYGLLSIVLILVAGGLFYWSHLSEGVLKASDNPSSLIIQVSSLSKAVHVGLLLLGFLHILIGMDVTKNLKLPAIFFAVILFCLGSLLLMSMVQNILLLFLLLEMSSIGIGGLLTYCEQGENAKTVVKSYWMNQVVSMILFFWGIVFLWGMGKSFHFSQLSDSISLLLQSEGNQVWGIQPEYCLISAILLMVASLGVKMGLIPFQSGTIFLRSKVSFCHQGVWVLVQFTAGVIVLVRLNEICFIHLPDMSQLLLLIIAGGTMLIPAILATRESEWSKVLSCLIAVHAGFLVLGVSSGIIEVTSDKSVSILLIPNGIHSAVYYLFVFLLMNAGLHGVLVALEKEGYQIRYLDDFRGLYFIHAPASLCLAVILVGLAGFPLTAGFWGRLFIAVNSLSVSVMGNHDAGFYPNPVFFVMTLILCLTTLMIAMIYFRVLGSIFFKRPVKKSQKLSGQFALSATMFAAMLTIGLGLFPSALIQFMNVNEKVESSKSVSVIEKSDSRAINGK